MYSVGWNVAGCSGMLRGVRPNRRKVMQLDRSGATGDSPGTQGLWGSFHFCPFSLSPFLPPTPNHPFCILPTLTGSQEWSEYHYLAVQNLSSDQAAYEACLQVLPCLLFSHQPVCVESDFHHAKSSGCAVWQDSNQRPGLHVGKGDSINPSSTYFFFSLICLVLLQAQVWGYLWHSPKLGERLLVVPGRGQVRSRRRSKCGDGGGLFSDGWGVPMAHWDWTCLTCTPDIPTYSLHPQINSKTGRKPVCHVFLPLFRPQ